jgi:integrase
MPVRRDPRTGSWFYRKTVRLPDGRRVRIFGVPDLFGLPDTKVGAVEAERRALERTFATGAPQAAKKEVPTFKEWFEGRFWREWVVGHRNKPSEKESKEGIFKVHLLPELGARRLDEIGAATIAQFRASLVEKELSPKRMNNVLAVLSKALRYAEEAAVIDKAPRVRLYRVERPEIEAWSFEEYGRLLAAARGEEMWHLAVLLGGDAGLRIGEIRALDWNRDIDLIGRTLTVNAQMRHGETGTPKGRTRRRIPMTPRLHQALRTLPTIRHGHVLRNPDGKALRDPQTSHATYRLCRLAGLPERGWHVLRHCFGTHAALFGVNPWALMDWMGHKRVDETMLYVHFASAHGRPIPPEVLSAGEQSGETDPSRKTLVMLGARGSGVAAETALPANHSKL